MNEFEKTLTALFDDAASSIEPRPDFERVLSAGRGGDIVVARTSERWRPGRRVVSVGAAAAVLVGLPAIAAAATMGGKAQRITISVPADTVETSTTPVATIPLVTSTSTTTTVSSTTIASTTTEVTTTVATTVAPPPPETSTAVKKTTSTTVAKPKEVAPVGFAVVYADGSWDTLPMKVTVKGTAPLGSHVHAETHWGQFDPVVDAAGNWKLRFEIGEVEVGQSVAVRLTNDATGEVAEISVTRPAPKVYDFYAQAAFKECNSTPPYNEYWGKAAPGSTISFTSAYGNGEVVVGADGKWSKRLEFPDSPIGTTFAVRVASSSGGTVYEFPMTRTPPA